MNIPEHLNDIYAAGFRDNWSLPAITDYTTGKTFTYGALSYEIARIHMTFELSGLKRGDKVALIGKNSPGWILVFMATVTYGATIVPILQEFNPTDAQHIINHSESVMLFVDDNIWESFELEKMPRLRGVISLNSGKMLAEDPSNGGVLTNVTKNINRRFRRKYKGEFVPEYVRYVTPDDDAVAVLNYTSGTTGFSKGVMLTYRNLWGNVSFGISSRLHYQGSRCLSFLPLAHAYGCAFDMLVPLAVGTHITVFGKLPTPNLLLKALSQVKANLVV